MLTVTRLSGSSPAFLTWSEADRIVCPSSGLASMSSKLISWMLLSLRRGAPPLLPSASGADLRDPRVAGHVEADRCDGAAEPGWFWPCASSIAVVTPMAIRSGIVVTRTAACLDATRGWRTQANRCRSIRVHAPFATVVGIADQSLALGIDDPVKCLERNLADQDRVFVADLPDVERAIATLNRQADCAVDGNRKSPPSPREWRTR